MTIWYKNYLFAGTTFTFNIEYDSENGTGPGQILMKIDTVDKIPTGNYSGEGGIWNE